VDASLKALSYNLALIKSKAYDKQLLELDLKANSFREGSLDLKEYCAHLIKSASDKNIDISDFTNIAILTGTVGLESDIDFKKSTIERDELVERLTRYLPKTKVDELAAKTVEFKVGRLTPSEFYIYIFDKARSADIDLAGYGNLTRYYGYINTYDKIKKEDLFKELFRLEAAVKEKLFSNAAQRGLDRVTKDLTIIKGIFNITITPDEFKVYKERRSDFDIRKIALLLSDTASKYSLSIPAMPDAARLDSRLKEMERFYELSYKRDEAFVRNIKVDASSFIVNRSSSIVKQKTINDRRLTMDGRGVVIVITGGFHTDNLTKLFKSNGINYVSIMPNFRLDNTPCPYFKRLAGEEPALFKRMTSGRSAIALYTYFCKKAKEIYGDGVEGMTETWIHLSSALLSGKEIVTDGNLSFTVSDTVPEGAEEVPGAIVNGRKVYALWNAASGISGPGKTEVSPERSWASFGHRFTRAIILAVSLLYMSVSSHGAAYAADSAVSLTNMAASGKMGEFSDKMWGSDPIVSLLQKLRITVEAKDLTKRFSRGREYFEKLPNETKEHYMEWAKIAGIPDKYAPLVFAALELTETSGNAILNPEDASLVISKRKAVGPLQVMLAQCNRINKYIKTWDKELKETSRTRLKSKRDQPKLDIVTEFGLANGTYIEMNKLQPLLHKKVKVSIPGTRKKKTIIQTTSNPDYDPEYARKIGALILALDYNFFLSQKMVITQDLLCDLENNDGTSEYGFDPLLAAIAAYNAGAPSVIYTLKITGPMIDYKTPEAWYVSFIQNLEFFQTRYHNVNFKAWTQILLYSFVGTENPDEIDVGDHTEWRERYLDRQPLRDGVKDKMQDIVSIDETDIKEVTSDAISPEEQAAVPEEDKEPGTTIAPVEQRSIFKSGIFWAGFLASGFLSAVVFFVTTKILQIGRKPKPEKEGDQKSPFMEGSIYNRKFIAKEKEESSHRYTVVFDMDETILWWSHKFKEYYLRPDAEALLTALKNRGVKVVLWTSEPRERVEEVLAKFPALTSPDSSSRFDLIITKGNYADLSNLDYIRWRFFNRIRRLPVTFKNIGVLGYHVLVDDFDNNYPDTIKIVKSLGPKGLGFQTIIVKPFNFDNKIHGDQFDSKVAQEEAGVDKEIMLSIIPALWPWLPSAPAQMGKRAKGKMIYDKKLEALDSSGYTTTIDLIPQGEIDISGLKSRIAGMEDVSGDHKETLLAVLSLLESSPPKFYTYDTIVEDLFGLADPKTGSIAIHRDFADDPVALFHEIGEYLIRSRILTVRFRDGKLWFSANGIPVGKTIALTKEDSRTMAARKRYHPHYVLRGLQREVFRARDLALESKIREKQLVFPDEASKTAYRQITNLYMSNFTTRNYKQSEDPYFYPAEFAEIFRQYYPEPDRKARIAFEIIIWRMGQWRWREFFWKSYLDENYAWRRDIEDLKERLGKLSRDSGIEQIHMDGIEYMYEDLEPIPADMREDFRKAVVLVNSWIRDGKVIDESPNAFIDHVQMLHAVAAASLPDTEIENDLSVARRIDVINPQRPLVFHPPSEMDGMMRQLAADVCSTRFKDQHPVLQAAEIYLRLTDMQYFSDGNRRVAKLIMDYYLMRNHLPALKITPENRDGFAEVTRFMTEKADVASFVADELLIQYSQRKTGNGIPMEAVLDSQAESKKMIFAIHIRSRMSTDEILLRVIEEKDRMRVRTILSAFIERMAVSEPVEKKGYYKFCLRVKRCAAWRNEPQRADPYS